MIEADAVLASVVPLGTPWPIAAERARDLGFSVSSPPHSDGILRGIVREEAGPLQFISRCLVLEMNVDQEGAVRAIRVREVFTGP